MGMRPVYVDECTVRFVDDSDYEAPASVGDYDKGYDMGCDVRNKYAEPCPDGVSDDFRAGFEAGLGDRGAYYRVNDL